MKAIDLDLLSEYTGKRSEAAFAELVRRHLDLVYSAALRQVRSPELAQEVAQSVFVDLAQNASRLKRDTILTAWLYEVSRRTAVDVIRRESRRQAREQIAVEVADMKSDASEWANISPLLDDAMESLETTDRAAVLLRFFENKSLREVGEALGTSEDAAQKRVSRAVDRLREILGKRGVTMGAGGLGVLIAANAVQAAPVGLASAITAAAIAGAATGGGVATLLKIMTMTKLKLAVLGALIVAVAATPVAIQHHAQVKLAGEIQSLRQRLDRVAAENEELSNQLSQAKKQTAASEQTDELAKLRQEVADLERRNRELAGRGKQSAGETKSFATQTNVPAVLDSPTVPLLPTADWADVGRSTPKSTLETLYWGMAKHATNTFAAAMAWNPDARAKAEALFAAAPESVRQRFGSVDGVVYSLFSGISPISGFAVVSENVDGDDGSVIEQHQYEDGRVRQNQVAMHHFDDGWRIVLGDEKLMRGFDVTLRRAARANGN